MMPRSPLLLCCLLLALPGLAQPPAAVEPNRVDAQGRKQGAWSKAWTNGKVRYEGGFKDDKPTGVFKHYDPDGVLLTIQRHAGDGRTSRAEHFHPDGGLMAAGKYLGQEKDSTWNYYDTEGRLRMVERYKAGRQHGEQTTYYPGGALAAKEHYMDGVRHGESRTWFADGTLRHTATYVKGEAEGAMTWFFANGRKEIEGKMVNGVRDGGWTYHNADGSLRMQTLYRQGRLVKEKKENGTFTEHYDDERPKSEVTYKKGLREGPFTEYHDNGGWVVKHVPADPIKGFPADMERVLQGQTKKREGKYKNDMLEGDVKEYDEKGKLVKVVKYVAGVAQ